MPIDLDMEDIISRRAWDELLAYWKECDLRYASKYVTAIKNVLEDSKRIEDIAMLAATIIDGSDNRDTLQDVHNLLKDLSYDLIQMEEKLEQLSKKIEIQ